VVGVGREAVTNGRIEDIKVDAALRFLN